MMINPSRLPGTAARDRRPPMRSSNTKTTGAAGEVVVASPHGGRGGGGRHGGVGPRFTSSSVRNDDRRPNRAGRQSITRPLPAAHQAPPPPPIVRMSAAATGGSLVSFQLQSLTAGGKSRAAHCSDPAEENHTTNPAPVKSRSISNKAWATTAVTATTTTNEPNEQQLTTTASTTANQGKVGPSHSPPSTPQVPVDGPESQPLPLSASDTNLPSAPPTSPAPPPPPIHKPLRPQRPQRSRGCVGARATAVTTTVATTSKPRDDDIKSQTGTASDLSVSPVTVTAEPVASDGCTSSSTAEEPEGPVTPPMEPEEADPCRRPPALPLPAMPETVDDTSRRARTRARAWDRVTTTAVPLAIFCNSCEPTGSSSLSNGLRVSIVPTHDDVPLTSRDYAALIGHVTAHSDGDVEAAAQKAECILVDALDRQLTPTQRHHVA